MSLPSNEKQLPHGMGSYLEDAVGTCLVKREEEIKGRPGGKRFTYQ